MLSILSKELQSFFASPIAYLVIGVYLLINGLFLWVFEGELNILNAGFADLSSYFYLAPWVLVFLIPAVTMKSFSEELNSGTLELLKTKPLSFWNILLGKYIGAMLLIGVAILPTVVYVYSIYKLGNPVGNIKLGTTFASFFGLFLLITTYTSIGIFASTLSKNQIVAFVVAVFTCFFFYHGFEALASFDSMGGNDYLIEQIGMSAHYKSVGNGVIDTRDLVYFLSITIFFLFIAKKNLERES
jgi:ABC-2 type transport system permease protein